MNNDNIQARMAELMLPIEKQILMCDDREDLLMMACAMLQHVRTIFDQEIGVNGRKEMFKAYTEKDNVL
jgi:hypothetical protein